MIPKEAPWKTSALNEQFRKERGCEFSVRYVWNGAEARLRWNTVLRSEPLVKTFPLNLYLKHIFFLKHNLLSIPLNNTLLEI